MVYDHFLFVYRCFYCPYSVRILSVYVKINIRTLYGMYTYNFVYCYVQYMYAKLKGKINMSATNRVEIRLEKDYIDMLDMIEVMETSNSLEGVVPINRTYVIKKAIKEYYLKTVDRKARNALTDQVETVMESQLKHFVDELNAAVSSKLLTLQYHLDEQLIREYLMLMILMKSSGLENHYDKVDENLRNDFNLAELFNDRAAEILEEIK